MKADFGFAAVSIYRERKEKHKTGKKHQAKGL